MSEENKELERILKEGFEETKLEYKNLKVYVRKRVIHDFIMYDPKKDKIVAKCSEQGEDFKIS